jgi:hypothetical protein
VIDRIGPGRWLLPQPKVAYTKNEWVPIPKPPGGYSTLKEPFGYRTDPENPDIYLPIPDELAALEKARKHLKRYKSRDVAAWLSKITGRKISHEGLLTRLRYEQYNKTKASTLRAWARRYKKAILLAEKYEKKKGAKRSSVLEELKCNDWGIRDRSFVNVTTDPDGSRRVYKLCGCRCECCSRPDGTEHNLQAESGTADSVSGGE